MVAKRPFDIDLAVQRIRQAVRPFPKAAMFALAEEGFATAFELLVAFGKHVCTGRLPRCSTCPVLDMCRQVAVDEHR